MKTLSPAFFLSIFDSYHILNFANNKLLVTLGIIDEY